MTWFCIQISFSAKLGENVLVFDCPREEDWGSNAFWTGGACVTTCCPTDALKKRVAVAEGVKTVVSCCDFSSLSIYRRSGWCCTWGNWRKRPGQCYTGGTEDQWKLSPLCPKQLTNKHRNGPKRLCCTGLGGLLKPPKMFKHKSLWKHKGESTLHKTWCFWHFLAMNR